MAVAQGDVDESEAARGAWRMLAQEGIPFTCKAIRLEALLSSPSEKDCTPRRALQRSEGPVPTFDPPRAPGEQHRCDARSGTVRARTHGEACAHVRTLPPRDCPAPRNALAQPPLRAPYAAKVDVYLGSINTSFLFANLPSIMDSRQGRARPGRGNFASGDPGFTSNGSECAIRNARDP